MADFRRWFTALAVLALMAGLASAQIGTASGSATGPLTCTANAAATPQLRPEGYTELVGDILITCFGGPALVPGAAIPTTNITIYVSPSVPITSRLIGSGSEVLLLIDDPGSTLPTGANDGNAGFGPRAAQKLCTSLTGGCPAFVGVDKTGLGAGTYEVMSGTLPTGPAFAASTDVANIYQGVVGALGPHTVTFYGVPVLPPVTSGVSRTFRITNLRIPTVNPLAGGAGSPIQVFISTNPSQALPLALASLPVGVIGLPTTYSSNLGPLNPFAQCTPQARQLTATLTYREGFATAFKTRVVPFPTTAPGTAYSAEAINTGIQNVPGGTYGGFSSNSESGFIYPVSGGTAGLADYGTRLKAVFTNIPAGVTLYVSTTSSGPASPIGGSSVVPTAILVATGQTLATEAGSDGAAFSGGIAATTTGSDGLGAVALSPTAGGVATAVWEITNANPSAPDSVTFSVYIGYTPNSGAVSPANPFGLPAVTSGILGALVSNVQMSMAPEPSGGAFSAAAAGTASSGLTIPRFAIGSSANVSFTRIGLCQTTLLYPFVTGYLAAGFETGIAVANTSSDPFGLNPGPIANTISALKETGACALYAYGSTFSAAGVASLPGLAFTLPGCDNFAGVPGQSCFPIVPTGSVQAIQASVVFPNFQGYVIAVCNFQYAHGYAAISDVGIRNFLSSYLALELEPGVTTCTGTAAAAGSAQSFTCTGNTTRGVGIESLIH